MTKDINAFIKEYDALTEQRKAEELTATEIKTIWDTGKAINGELDTALAICNAYAVGYMTATKKNSR